MGEARVIINLKEGIIELQGPVDFVRHYLDTYQPAIKGLQDLPKFKEVVASPEKAKALPRKRKTAPAAKAKKGKRTSCAGAIRSELKAGFFDEPRSTSEVKRQLSQTGLTFTDEGVRVSLRRLSLAGSLDAVREGRSVRYQRPAKF